MSNLSSFARREAELLRKDQELERRKSEIVENVDRTIKQNKAVVQSLVDNPVTHQHNNSYNIPHSSSHDASTTKVGASVRGAGASHRLTSSSKGKRTRKQLSPRSMEGTNHVNQKQHQNYPTGRSRQKQEYPQQSRPRQANPKLDYEDHASTGDATASVAAVKSVGKGIQSALGNIQGASWTADASMLEEMGVEAMVRYLKARVVALEEKEKKILSDKGDVEHRLQQAMQKLSEHAEKNKKTQRALHQTQGALEKQKKATHTMRLNAERAQAALDAARKDLQTARRDTTQKESEVSHKDLRLSRALEEVSGVVR